MRAYMKTFFGYALILFSLLFMIVIAFPQFYSMNASGRIDKNISLKFDFLEDENSSVVLLFFGYVGCGDICVPAMNELSRIYKQLDKNKVKVYFINILNTTNKDAPHVYAKEFHDYFKGIYLDNIEIGKIAKKLNLALVKVNDKEMGHTGHLFVLNSNNKKHTLEYIYTTRPFAENSIVKDINKLIQRGDET